MAKVAICTPHGGAVRPDYYRGVLTMQGEFPQHEFFHVEVDTMIIGKARNLLIQTAKQFDVDALWFIDDDVVVPPHSGVLIDQSMSLGVASGVYFSRRPPYHIQVYRRAMEPENIGMFWPLIEYPASGLVSADAVGAGCVCVRHDIFDKLEERWLERVKKAHDLLEWDPAIAELVVRLSPWFEFLDRKGEDLYFSERCREINQAIHVNYDVKCAHMAEVEIVEEHWLAVRDSGALQIEPIGGDKVPMPEVLR